MAVIRSLPARLEDVLKSIICADIGGEIANATAPKAHPPPDKWTSDNLSATFKRKKVLKFTFTT